LNLITGNNRTDEPTNLEKQGNKNYSILNDKSITNASNTNNLSCLNSKLDHEVNKSNINNEKQHEDNINNEEPPGKLKDNDINIKNQYSTVKM